MPGALFGRLRLISVIVFAHNTGFTEIWYGTIDSPRLKPATDVVARTENAKEYNTAGKRIYGLVEGNLMYAYNMATGDQGIQSHQWGRLTRV